MFFVFQGWVDNYNGPTGLLAAVSIFRKQNKKNCHLIMLVFWFFSFCWTSMKIYVGLWNCLNIDQFERTNLICIKYSYLYYQIGNGLLRIMKGNFYGTSDVIPVDIASNMMISVAWDNVVHKYGTFLWSTIIFSHFDMKYTMICGAHQQFLWITSKSIWLFFRFDLYTNEVLYILTLYSDRYFISFKNSESP